MSSIPNSLERGDYWRELTNTVIGVATFDLVLAPKDFLPRAMDALLDDFAVGACGWLSQHV